MNEKCRRRHFLRCLSLLACLLAPPHASVAEPADADLFGEPAHKLVYQLNKADADYIEHILFSVGAMLRKYSDDIHLVVVAMGPG